MWRSKRSRGDKIVWQAAAEKENFSKNRINFFIGTRTLHYMTALGCGSSPPKNFRRVTSPPATNYPFKRKVDNFKYSAYLVFQYGV